MQLAVFSHWIRGAPPTLEQLIGDDHFIDRRYIMHSQAIVGMKPRIVRRDADIAETMQEATDPGR
jgi:hypothetical protein